jgi:membrane-associated phospholipid phosphatase
MNGGRRRTILGVALGALLAAPGPLAAQHPQAAEQREHVALKWWHPLVASAGITALFLIDEPVRDFVQDHRSAALDDVADVGSHFHEPNIFLVSGVGAMSVGLLAREPKVAQTGLQIIAAYGLSSAMMIGTKWSFGRSRPRDTPEDNVDMSFFGGGANSAFPSGASTVVFSLATTVSDAVGHPAVTVLLYSGAAVNAWARVNDDRHWLSDVALGALYGITSAKLVNGHWRVFGLRPPTVGIDSRGDWTVAYRVSYEE